MRSRSFISLHFIENSQDISSIENVLKFSELVNDRFPIKITDIVSTRDWYEISENVNVFDFLSNELEDAQLRAAIIGRLAQIFGNYLDEDIDNSCAKLTAQAKYDSEFYYSIVSSWDVIDELQQCNIISNKEDYIFNHEIHLSLLPKSNKDYAYRCKLIFDKIIFSDDFEDTISTLGRNQGIVNFSKPITKAISALNKLDPKIRNIQNVMHWIRSECGFECSPQGADKAHLTTNIALEDGRTINVNCEFHIKISESNLNGNVNYYSRIYFGLLPEGQEKYSYLLHCGEHL